MEIKYALIELLGTLGFMHLFLIHLTTFAIMHSSCNYNTIIIVITIIKHVLIAAKVIKTCHQNYHIPQVLFQIIEYFPILASKFVIRERSNIIMTVF